MPIDLNPLETAIDELKQKVEDFETILKKKDLTLLELYLQGGIMPQVHKGPLAYAEAFLEPTDLNMQYSREIKKKFKHIFKRLIELYQKGIDLYGQLGASSSTNAVSQPNANGGGDTAAVIAPVAVTQHNNKYAEMHRLLQEKYNEVENSFRNLLLIDGVSECRFDEFRHSALNCADLFIIDDENGNACDEVYLSTSNLSSSL